MVKLDQPKGLTYLGREIMNRGLRAPKGRQRASRFSLCDLFRQKRGQIANVRFDRRRRHLTIKRAPSGSSRGTSRLPSLHRSPLECCIPIRSCLASSTCFSALSGESAQSAFRRFPEGQIQRAVSYRGPILRVGSSRFCRADLLRKSRGVPPGFVAAMKWPRSTFAAFPLETSNASLSTVMLPCWCVW